MSGKPIDIESSLKLVEHHILNSEYDQAIKICLELNNQYHTDSEKIRILFSLSRSYLGNRNFLEALETIKSIPKSEIIPEIWMLKSQTEMYLGMHLESLYSANKAIELREDLIGAYVFKAQALKHLYRDQEAEEALESGLGYIKKFHGIREIKYDLEKTFLARACQQYDQGIKYSKYVVQEAPNYATGYLHYGINLLLKYLSESGIVLSSSSSNLAKKTDLFYEAVEILNKAIELNKHDSVAMYYKGVAFESTGDIDQALNLYHMAADLSKGYANPVLALVNLHMQRGEDDIAITYIDALVELNPSEEALLAKAKAYASADRFEEAEITIDRLITENPQNHYYYYRKALLEASQKKFEDCIVTCEKVLALKPLDIDTMYQQALAYASLHRFDESIDMIENVLSIKPEYALAHQAKGYVIGEIASRSPSEAFKFMCLTGKIPGLSSDILELLSEGKIEDAEIWYYNNINNRNKQSLELLENADKSILAGEFDSAISIILRSLEINPNFPLALYKISELYQTGLFRPDLAEPYLKRLEEFDDYRLHLQTGKKLPHILVLEDLAIEAHEKAISLDPNNPMVHSSIASTLGKFHRLSEMIEKADDAAELLSRENGATLAPEQIEYIKHQNEKRIELLQEIKHLVSIANSIQMNMEGNSINIIGSKTEEYEEREVMSQSSEIDPSIMLAPPKPKKICSLNEMRNLPSIRKFGNISRIELMSEDDSSRGFPISPQDLDVISESPIPREVLLTSTMNSLPNDFQNGLRTVISHTKISSLSSQQSSHGGDDLSHSLVQRNFMDLTLNSDPHSATKHQYHTVQIRNSLHSASSPLPPAIRQSSGESVSGVTTNTNPASPIVSETTKVDTVIEVVEDTHKKNMSIGALAKASMAVKTSLNMAARKDATIKDMQEQLKFLKQAIMDAQKHLIEEEQRNKLLAGEVSHLRDDLSYAISHDKELARYESEQNEINTEATGLLSQYQMGFVRTIQKFVIGALARTSGMVGDKNYNIPGLEYIPLPPIADEIVKAVQMVGSFALQVRDDNQITNFLNSLGNPMDFAQDTAPKIAARIAVQHNKKQAIIGAIQEERHGIFKVKDVYEKLKGFIWEKENPTYASQLGAEDAFKIIASFKIGHINLNRKNTAESVEDVVSMFLGHEYRINDSNINIEPPQTNRHVAEVIPPTIPYQAPLAIDTKPRDRVDFSFDQGGSNFGSVSRGNPSVLVSFTDSGHLFFGGVGVGTNHAVHVVMTPTARTLNKSESRGDDPKKIEMNLVSENNYAHEHPIKNWFKNAFCCCFNSSVPVVQHQQISFIHQGSAFHTELDSKTRDNTPSQTPYHKGSIDGGNSIATDSSTTPDHHVATLGDVNFDMST